MDHSGPIGCETENTNSTNNESSCSSVNEVTPNPFGYSSVVTLGGLVCCHCNLGFLNYKELVIHRKTHFTPKSNNNHSVYNKHVVSTYEGEEESNITLSNNCGILVYETTCHSGPSMNETPDNIGVVVNETDQLLVEMEGETNNEKIFVTETGNRSLERLSGNPGKPNIGLIINETDTYSSENRTHNPCRRLRRQEHFSESKLDYVDNTTSAKRPNSSFKINTRNFPKDQQLLYPEKYLKKFPNKKKVDNKERKSTQKSSNDTSNEKDGSNIICRNSEKLTNNSSYTTHCMSLEENCDNFDKSMIETCNLPSSVDETYINSVMIVNETCYPQNVVSPYEEEESNITLSNNCGILVYETTCHSVPSMNETPDNIGVVVNETDQLLVEMEGETNNEQIFATESSNRSLERLSWNPGKPDIGLIINETDTYSSENRTHNPCRLLERREHSSGSEMDYVDNTPSAKSPHSTFKRNRRKLPKDCQLLYPGKYLKKMPSKKRVDLKERKSSQRSKNDDSNEKDSSNVICRNSDTSYTTHCMSLEETCDEFDKSMNETCNSPLSVDETCINSEMIVNETFYSQIFVDEAYNNPVLNVNETHFSQISVDETHNNSVIPVNGTTYSQFSVDETYNNPMILPNEMYNNPVLNVNETHFSQISVDETHNNSVIPVNGTSYSQFPVDETCNNLMIPVNETCNSEITIEETHVIDGNFDENSEHSNEDLRIGEKSFNQTEFVAQNINSGSSMKITRNISQSETNSEVDLDCIKSTPFQENIRYGVTMRKKGKINETAYLSVPRRRFQSTRNHKFNSSSGMNKKFKSDSEELSFTCMEAFSAPQLVDKPSTSQDLNELEIISNSSDTSSNGSYEFERNENVRENLENSILAVVRESIGSDNISESFSNEDLPVMVSRNRLGVLNDGYLNSMIVDSDVDDIDFDAVISSNQHRSLIRNSSVTNTGKKSDDQESLRQSVFVERGNNVIASESSKVLSFSCATPSIDQARSRASILDETPTRGGNQLTHNSKTPNTELQGYVDSCDSENEFPRELNPFQWLCREHRRFIEDWCIGKVKTEFKCRYCEEVCESHDQLTIHVQLKHILALH